MTAHHRLLAGAHRRPALLTYAGVLVLFTAITAIVFAELIGDLGGRILWNFSDASNGIRYYWAVEHAGTDPFHFQHDYLNGAPEGLPTPGSANVAAPLQPALVWSLKPILGIHATFNLLMLAGYILTGVAAFALLHRLLRLHPVAAFFGAYVMTFNPWMIYKARDGHIAYTQGWSLLLVLAAALWLIRTRRPLAAVALALAVGLTFWISSYWGFLGSVIAGVALLVDFFNARSWVEKLWTSTLTCIAVGIGVVFLVPGALAYAAHREQINQSIDNPASQLQSCAARPASYLLPAAGHPLCGELAERAAEERRVGVNEQTLFFGYTTYLLAGGVGIAALRRRLRLTDTQRQAVTYSGALALVAVYFSLPRLIDLGFVTLPAPSWFVGHLTSFFRCYARFGYVAGIALAVLAAFGLHLLIHRYGRRGIWLGVVATALVAFELLYGWMSAWQADRPPPHVDWLAEQPRGIVANYPAPTGGSTGLLLAQRELYYQRFHGQPLFTIFGGGFGNTREEAIRILTRRITDPRAPGVLAAEGVRYVLLHDDEYRAQGEIPPTPPAESFDLLARIGDVRAFALRVDPVDLERELAERAPEIALVQGLPDASLEPVRGFVPADPGMKLEREGVLRATDPGSPSTRFALIGSALTDGGAAVLQVILNGESVGQVGVGLAQTPLNVPLTLPRGASELVLRVADGSDSTLTLFDLRLQPLPNYTSIRER